MLSIAAHDGPSNRLAGQPHDALAIETEPMQTLTAAILMLQPQVVAVNKAT